MFLGADGMEPSTYSQTILKGVLYMYPSSIQEGETKIFQLVTRSSNLQAELAQVQINSQSAENELQMQFFAEERKRLMNEIDTTQRLIVCLDRWIRDERIKELNQQPRSIACAKDETNRLLLNVADIRARIESIDSKCAACANLIATRRWISARLDYLNKWIDGQMILSEMVSIPEDMTEPSSIESAQGEINRLPHEIKMLIGRFEDMPISDNPDERVNLLLQIKSKKARNDFLVNWISQTRRARCQEAVDQIASISSDEPASVSAAKKQCEELSKHSISTQSRIRMLHAEDDTEDYHDKSALQAEGLSIETDDGILCSVDTVLIEIDKEFCRAIASNPKRLAIWNAVRKRIGFGTIKPRRD